MTRVITDGELYWDGEKFSDEENAKKFGPNDALPKFLTVRDEWDNNTKKTAHLGTDSDGVVAYRIPRDNPGVVVDAYLETIRGIIVGSY